MWKDLSFKERAEMINQWHREHVLDYSNKKREYDEAHKFTDGGDTNPMNYKYMGTIQDDELKKEGIDIVTTPLKEVTITGKAPDRPYFSSYDPMALYRYGVEPALEGMGAVVDRALHPIDVAIDTATSPAWWINKAITGNSDNAVQSFRDWTHTAMRDAGMLLSPTRDMGTVLSGFNYAPWSEDNPGLFGTDYTGQAMNNTFDLLLGPLGPKAAVEGVKEVARTPRARAAIYNNITPWSYKDKKLGSYEVKKLREMTDAAREFLTPGAIDVSYPRWLQRFDEALKQDPEIAIKNKMFDYDAINAPAIMEFRDQAWAKAMRQPDSDRWTAKIYKDNGDGTYSYDLDAVDKIRKKYGNGEFSGLPSDDVPTNGFEDNITYNGGNVGLQRLSDSVYRMYDTWDLQPWLARVNSWLNPSEYTTPTTMQRISSALPQFMREGLRKAGRFEAVDFFGGDPFKLDMTWDSNNPRFFTTIEE